MAGRLAAWASLAVSVSPLIQGHVSQQVQRCEALLSKRQSDHYTNKGPLRALQRIENMKRDAETKTAGGGEPQWPSV